MFHTLIENLTKEYTKVVKEKEELEIYNEKLQTKVKHLTFKCDYLRQQILQNPEVQKQKSIETGKKLFKNLSNEPKVLVPDTCVDPVNTSSFYLDKENKDPELSEHSINENFNENDLCSIKSENNNFKSDQFDSNETRIDENIADDEKQKSENNSTITCKFDPNETRIDENLTDYEENTTPDKEVGISENQDIDLDDERSCDSDCLINEDETKKSNMNDGLSNILIVSQKKLHYVNKIDKNEMNKENVYKGPSNLPIVSHKRKLPSGDKNEELNQYLMFNDDKPEGIKYVENTVRKKKDRQELQGFDCIECRKYYEAAQMTDSEIQKQLQKCSKHRSKFPRPNTPEGYWSLGIPDHLIPERQKPDDQFQSKKKRPLQMPNKSWKYN